MSSLTRQDYEGLFSGCILNLDMNGDSLDSSGDRIDGVVSGAILAPDQFGIIDNAYSFTKGGYQTSDQIICGPSDVFNSYNQGTIEILAYCGPGKDMYIGYYKPNAYSILRIGLLSGTVHVQTFQAVAVPNFNNYITYLGVLPDLAWRAVHITSDGSNYNCHVNGGPPEAFNIAVGSNTGIWFDGFSTGMKFSIGYVDYVGTPSSSDTETSNVAVFNRVLSQAEIKARADLLMAKPNFHEFIR